MTYGLHESNPYGVCWPCEQRARKYGRQMYLFLSPDCLILLVCLSLYPSYATRLANKRTETSSKELADLGLFASILGHIGDGNFHAAIMHNKKDPEERARVEKVVYDMVDRALEMDGSCTVISHPLRLIK